MDPVWGELLLFFKSSGGSVLRTSTFSETSFSETTLVGGVLCLDALFGLWSRLGLPVRHGVYF